MNRVLYGLAVAVFIFVTGCSQHTSTLGKAPEDGRASLFTSDQFNGIENLAKATPTVIMGSAVGEGEIIDYQDIKFVKTQFMITEVLRDEMSRDVDNNREITLLQTYSEDDPELPKGQEMLLFVEPYVGPILENAYVIKGLSQGQYTVDSENKVHSKSTIFHEDDHRSAMSVNAVKEVLINNKYTPEVKKKRSESQIEEESRKEVELHEINK